MPEIWIVLIIELKFHHCTQVTHGFMHCNIDMCPVLKMSSSMKPCQREEANTRDKIPYTCWVLVNKLIWLPAIHKNGSQHPIRGTQPTLVKLYLKWTVHGTEISILKRHQIRNESTQDFSSKGHPALGQQQMTGRKNEACFTCAYKYGCKVD